MNSEEKKIWEQVPYVLKRYYDEYGLDDDTVRELFPQKDIVQYSKENIYSQILVLDRLYRTRLNDYKSEDNKCLRSVTVKDMATHIYNNRQHLSRIIKKVKNLNVSEGKYAEAYKAIVLLLQVSFEGTKSAEKKIASLPYSFATKYCSFLCPDEFVIYDSSIEAFFKIECIKNKYHINSFSVTGNNLKEVRDAKGYINLLSVMNQLVSDDGIANYFDGVCCLKTMDMFIWKKWKEEQNN